jgi:hypothetical protein
VSHWDRWEDDAALVLQIKKPGGTWEWGPSAWRDGSGLTNTGGAITYADPNYRFKACIFRGAEWTCTDPW